MIQSILTGRLFFCGFLIWVVPFVLAIPLFQILGSNRIFFKSILVVILTIVVVMVWNFYLKKINSQFIRHASIASPIWILMSIVPDLFAFILGFNMAPSTYFSEIATSYLIISVILIGNAWTLENKKNL